MFEFPSPVIPTMLFVILVGVILGVIIWTVGQGVGQ